MSERLTHFHFFSQELFHNRLDFILMKPHMSEKPTSTKFLKQLFSHTAFGAAGGSVYQTTIVGEKLLSGDAKVISRSTGRSNTIEIYLARVRKQL